MRAAALGDAQACARADCTRAAAVEELPGRPDWPYRGYGAFGPYDLTQFITRYSGKVVANLRTDAGRRMRCRLHLVAPARGMAGGGEGECQMQGGGIVHASF